MQQNADCLFMLLVEDLMTSGSGRALPIDLTAREEVHALIWGQTPAKQGESFCVWPCKTQTRRDVQSANRDLVMSRDD